MTAALLALLLVAAPCPPPGADASPPDAEAVTHCAYEHRTPTRTETDGVLLQAILDRPAFADARARSGDGLARLLDLLAGWLEQFAGTGGAQSFAQRRATLLDFLAPPSGFDLRQDRVRARVRAEPVPCLGHHPRLIPAHAP